MGLGLLVDFISVLPFLYFELISPNFSNSIFVFVTEPGLFSKC
jgi:hypothetical protein